MRKVIAYLAISADGFIARKDGGVEWLDRPMPKGSYGMGKFMRSVDTILFGRATYDVGLKLGGPNAGSMPGCRSYVFTRRPAEAVKGVTFVDEPIVPFTKRLRAEKGKDIWMMGGGQLIASFLDVGELDELQIHVIPVLIGEGIPLLAPRHRLVKLKLLATRHFPDGVVFLRYAVRKPRKSRTSARSSS